MVVLNRNVLPVEAVCDVLSLVHGIANELDERALVPRACARRAKARVDLCPLVQRLHKLVARHAAVGNRLIDEGDGYSPLIIDCVERIAAGLHRVFFAIAVNEPKPECGGFGRYATAFSFLDRSLTHPFLCLFHAVLGDCAHYGPLDARGERLPEYRLDAVAMHFIQEKPLVPVRIAAQPVDVFYHNGVCAARCGTVLLSEFRQAGAGFEFKPGEVVGEYVIPGDFVLPLTGHVMNVFQLAGEAGATFVGLVAVRDADIGIRKPPVRVSYGPVRCQLIKVRFEEIGVRH